MERRCMKTVVLLSLHATAFLSSFSRVSFWSVNLEVKEMGTWRNEKGEMSLSKEPRKVRGIAVLSQRALNLSIFTYCFNLPAPQCGYVSN